MKIPKNIYGRHKIRDAKICLLWMEGELRNEDIAVRFKITERRVSKIVEMNKQYLLPDIQFEKAKRVRWYKSQLRLKKKSAKDPADIQEQIRKEIEGDKPLIEQHSHVVYVWQGDRNPILPPELSEGDAQSPGEVQGR